MEFTADVSDLERKAREYKVVVRKGSEEVMAEVGRRVAANLAFQTPPMGFDEGAHESGTRRVAMDVSRTSPGLSEGFYRYFERRAARGDELVYQRPDGSELRLDALSKSIDRVLASHERQRSKRGRIRAAPPDKVGTARAVREQIIGDKQAKVGYAKSGWVAAGMMLGRVTVSFLGSALTKTGRRRRVSARWVKRTKRSRGPGVGRVVVDPVLGVGFTLENKVEYVSAILTDKQQRAAVKREIATMMDLMERSLEAARRRAWRNTRRVVRAVK